ncbi:hypothetical protein Naga_100622g2 [Nannochloropsis gaditana]|uniref:Uncharacterized protein n=1 Tax=Nannochloropsis gaditana TaxID=72520 RepID=W7TIK5_9STRA|nr:hypothetical protein Naga_100622g2 [Nannochloropsis gaditana]
MKVTSRATRSIESREIHTHDKNCNVMLELISSYISICKLLIVVQSRKDPAYPSSISTCLPLPNAHRCHYNERSSSVGMSNFACKAT